MKNFMGLSGFVWWQGVVEDNDDPLVLGRCRVRILGFHEAADISTVPIEHLPWAHPIFPINGRDSYKIPNKGDWVVGFFRDGRDAQEPVMFGVLPGMILDPESIQVDEKYFGENVLTERHFNFAANNGLQFDSVFTSNTNVWWRVDEDIDSYSNNYMHLSNTSITLGTGTDEANTTNKIVMHSNSGIDITSNSNITIDSANNAMSLNAGLDVTATSNANSYPIVASFDELYERVKKLEEDLLALTAVVETKADAGHSHE
jgi:hypothetical protein